jgi:hypothetical protein
VSSGSNAKGSCTLLHQSNDARRRAIAFYRQEEDGMLSLRNVLGQALQDKVEIGNFNIADSVQLKAGSLPRKS